MKMNVKNRLTRRLPAINDEPEAVPSKAFAAGDLVRRGNDIGQEGSILGLDVQ
jgi:hypothetical protein